MSETSSGDRRPLPRHVLGAISVAIGFVGGIALLLVLPRMGLSPKLAGIIALVVWLGSTWVFWTGGKEPSGSGDKK